MRTTPTNENAGGQPGAIETAENKRKVITKLDRMIEILKTRPEGLNRFEAEAFGEHCLNSTAAVIRAMYGDRLIQRWETVPSRFTNKGVRVLRFWIVPRATA